MVTLDHMKGSVQKHSKQPTEILRPLAVNPCMVLYSVCSMTCLAQHFNGSRELLFTDLLILLFLCCCLEPLPWQGCPVEVHEDIPHALHVVPTSNRTHHQAGQQQDRLDLRLLYSQVSIDAGISSCASKVLVFSIHNVHLCSGVSVFLGQAKVNDEQLMRVWHDGKVCGVGKVRKPGS